ncbi:MAG: hypothetical protein LUG93_06195 [Lachnospiraceae bacterium]|nr:hypothetical protein [Lachnospiraceae bacterium]
MDTTGMDQPAYRQAAIDAVRQLSVDVGIPAKLEKPKEEEIGQTGMRHSAAH